MFTKSEMLVASALLVIWLVCIFWNRPDLSRAYAQTLLDVQTQARNVVPVQSGTYGDGTHTIQLTIDASGRITNLVLVPIQGGGNSSGPSDGTIPSGTFNDIPKACGPGQQYQATDQPAGKQLYLCNMLNGVGTYMLEGDVGGTGTLAVTDGSLATTALVPNMDNQNTWPSLQIYKNGIQLISQGSQPVCQDTTLNMHWFKDARPSATTELVCRWDGNQFQWLPIY